MRREREKIYIYGKHALQEALLNAPQSIKKIFLSGESDSSEIRELAKQHNISVAAIKGKEADRIVGEETTHQGIIGVADASRLTVGFNDFKAALKPDPDTMLVLLDELTDPHNVGAIIRSAVAFGASGILMPQHRQAPVTGAVVKTSAGMVFRVPIVMIGNVNYVIRELQDIGFKAYGLAMDGTKSTKEENFNTPSLFVVGNEGRGIREKTLELCDVKLKIPMHPRTESLNASVSAAIVLYEWGMQHPKSLR